jgi:hypothetical protein
MQRLNHERGAVGVVVALLMVPILGFAAIAIDVAAMYAERQELQAGADAGAMAIAQDCGRGACAASAQTAQSFAAANLVGASSTAAVTALSATEVTVRNAGIKQHLFAPVLGIDTTAIAASATAGWGAPTGGTTVLPLALSLCEWQAQTGGGLPAGTTARVISFPEEPDTGCTGKSGAAVSSGFGWLSTDAGSCQTTTAISDRVGSSTGDAPSAGCRPADLAAFQGKTVLLPVFDASGGSGSQAWYQVHGYAAFKITGYYFAGPYNWGSPCAGDDRCISGYFTRFVELNDTFTSGPDAPLLGASIVRLTH